MDLIFLADSLVVSVFQNRILLKTFSFYKWNACAFEFSFTQMMVQEPVASESPETWRKANCWATPDLLKQNL